MKREERKEMFARRKAEQRGEENRKYEQERLRQERVNRAAAAEESGYGLLHLGCTPETHEGATDLQEELAGAIYWHRLLGLPPVTPGSTLHDELSRQFCEYVRQGAKLFNPLTDTWSSSWTFEPRGKTFAESFTVIEGTKELILSPCDFEAEEN